MEETGRGLRGKQHMRGGDSVAISTLEPVYLTNPRSAPCRRTQPSFLAGKLAARRTDRTVLFIIIGPITAVITLGAANRTRTGRTLLPGHPSPLMVGT